MKNVKGICRMTVVAAITAAAMMAFSCGKDENFEIGDTPGASSNTGKRESLVETRNVLVLYEAGHNSLASYLDDDVNVELLNGELPKGGRMDDVLLVYSKLGSKSDYIPSYLKRIYMDSNERIVVDTLVTYDKSMNSASTECLRTVLKDVRNMFPAKGYGLLFSSHGSGWLPEGYYENPSKYESEHKSTSSISTMSDRIVRKEGIPSGDMSVDDPYRDMVRSIGQDNMGGTKKEMTIEEFANGIPYHLDYILFDMCFSGGVEVVYGLKDKADYIAISPAEVLADGMFNYSTLTGYLLARDGYNLSGLIEDSFERYNGKSGDYRSSTVGLVKTDGLDDLAAVCKTLIDKYRTSINNAPTSKIQGYFRYNRHYFYDLKDIFEKCGASSADLAALDAALDKCFIYKAATPSFLGAFNITNYSGLSMYLPCAGTQLLDNLYLKEDWNNAVGLVR